jgi:hypothetical protein
VSLILGFHKLKKYLILHPNLRFVDIAIIIIIKKIKIIEEDVIDK